MTCDHNVGTHLPRQIRRQVIHQCTIHIKAVSVANGIEDSWQGPGRPHSPANRTVREGVCLFGNRRLTS